MSKPVEKTEKQLREEIDALREENERMKSAQNEKVSILRLKVSEKGAVSLYGVGRFPFTAYDSQWAKILGFREEILKFIEDNKSSLKQKV